MSDIVFILGAGASKQCGAPLMNDFLDEAFLLWKAGKVPGKEEHFQRVFDARSNLQRVHSKSRLDIDNIESVFTAFEIANVLGKLPGSIKEDIPTIINSLKDVIVGTLEQTMHFPVIHANIFPAKPYDSFVELLHYLTTQPNPAQSVSVITFNYDIAVDFALYNKRVAVNYCIETTQKNSHGIPLLKLHGSLNWATSSETHSIIPLELSDYFNRYTIPPLFDLPTCSIPIGSQLQEFFEQQVGTNVDAAPVIVPPTWNKADYHHKLSNVWARAAKELEGAQSIFVIGYSLPKTDEFFKLLYALGTVGDTLLQRLMVFNPDKTGEVEKRFRSILGPGAEARFKYYDYTFESAIDKIRCFFPKRT